MRSTTIVETPRAGRVSFGFGECELHADDGRLELTGHLERFAFREELRVTWPGDAPEGV